MLGICGAVVGLRAMFPRFALYFVGLSALLSLALYAPSLDPPPGSAYSYLAAASLPRALLALELSRCAAIRIREPTPPFRLPA